VEPSSLGSRTNRSGTWDLAADVGMGWINVLNTGRTFLRLRFRAARSVAAGGKADQNLISRPVWGLATSDGPMPISCDGTQRGGFQQLAGDRLSGSNQIFGLVRRIMMGPAMRGDGAVSTRERGDVAAVSCKSIRPQRCSPGGQELAGPFQQAGRTS